MKISQLEEVPEKEYINQKDFSIKDYKKFMEQKGIFISHFKEKIDFLKLVKKIGIPHSHNKENNYIWDVKPTGKKNTLARSLTKKAFELHTDCSFENPSPNYFALYVLKNDTLGGGKNYFLDFKEIESLIDTSTKKILKENYFFVVPNEFNKRVEKISLPSFWKFRNPI